MAKKRPIKLYYGKAKELAQIMGVNASTVSEALYFRTDSKLQEEIRQKAKELGFVKRW